MKRYKKKRIVRRKRRISEREIMRIKRKLKKSAKKLRLGAKRTGAYVYGTLRRIVGNPMEYDVLRDKFEVMGGPITDKMQSLLRKIYNMRDAGKSEAQLRPFIKEYQRLKGLVTPLRRNPLSYHVGGLSSLGAKRESQRRMRTYNQIKKSIQRGNASYGELAVLQSLAKEHPKLFAGDPMMAEAGGMSEAQFRRLRGNPATKGRPIPGKFYRVYWSHPSRGETGQITFTGDQLLKIKNITELSRYWPIKEGLKMAKVHFRGPYDSWDDAFMNR